MTDTWDNFIQRHKETLWACDFFSVKTVTTRGLRDTYVRVWLCMTTREAIVSISTEHPNSDWVVDQAERFLSETAGRVKKPAIVMHNRDTKFSRAFTKKLNELGVRTNPLPKASPNLNGRCERFIETIKHECLLKFVIFGRRHLDHLIAEFTDYYNHQRSHMERDHLPPIREIPDDVEKLSIEQIEVKSYVGGLVKSFERKAA